MIPILFELRYLRSQKRENPDTICRSICLLEAEASSSLAEVTLKKAKAQGLRYLAEDVCAVGLQASLASLDAAVAAGSVPSKLLNEQPGQVRGVEGVILVMLMV